ncbi:hypothetical protein [Butyrivibrio sp. INlla16]|uniref:hypothetical protein n=1 Tax=Butyrivibrio sp. INlla16 TaxID=1520807 RepID=UPI000889B4D6|nr:hypothetical protein [Butyrivibrio sp. INlla16]SDB60905.1 hypothetical protein SAMN02910263_03225 [Butyrivibrio sp. INlla16]
MSNWQIMHDNRIIAEIADNGIAKVHNSAFMPFDLWLEEATDVDTLVNNLTNFYYWCASRVLTLDREYAKEILSSIGAQQGTTDKERAKVALSYHCLSLKDIYWVKPDDEEVSFDDINIYDNHLDNAFVDLSLRGKAMTVDNAHLIADDISTSGVCPKAWVRKADGFWLYKDGDIQNVENEILASKICRCFKCNQVLYEKENFDGDIVSVSKIMTSKKYSIATRAAFDIYAVNHEMDPIDEIIRLDGYGYYMMNILDYLVGNTDRHWENWGLLIDNETGKALRLHDLMDFNQAFKAYDNVDGALCQTTLPRRITQRQAAIEAVNEIGMNRISEVDPVWFEGRNNDYMMFMERMNILQSYA